MYSRRQERRAVIKPVKLGEGAASGRKQDHPTIKSGSNSTQAKKLSKSLEENISVFKNRFQEDDSVIYRRFENKFMKAVKCCIIFINGMIDYNMINLHIIEPVQQQELQSFSPAGNLLDELQNKVIQANDIQVSSDLEKIWQSICYGDTAFLLEGYDRALIIESKGWKSREITEPESSKVVRGPREGFTENILTNISLLRRKIKNPELKFQFMELGKQTHTQICICYLEGLAQESILVELKQRLNRIEIDAVLESGYIQELISDEPLSPFQTVGYSERPDVVAANMLEGRIAIIVDGSPFVLTVPFIAVEAVQFNEDYYNHFLYGSFNRFLRYLASIITVSIPAVFLAIVAYHQEMLPTPLLISISASLEGVPLPMSVSLFLMLIIFDILREAGTRMPTAIGQAINIVGTLVLGQAAVEAKLVSAPVIIITAISGITTLMLPRLIDALVLTRLFLLVCASFLGIYGYIFGVILVLLHLMSIRSFGIPYMMSMTHATDHEGQDCWIRMPWWTMTIRPKIIATRNMLRQIPRQNRGKSNG